MKIAREAIIKLLEQIIGEMAGEKLELNIEIPQDPSHGDYSSNIALAISKKLGKNPREVAAEIEKLIPKEDYLEKVEVAGPGFLNFYLSNKYLQENLNLICEKKDTYGDSDREKNNKVMVEFTDPNPLKEFHIGHLYSNTVGESIARLYESQGADVWRVNYQGDVGLHVAKAIYGILNHKLEIEEFKNKPLDEKAKFLGEAYALGAKAYEEDDSAKNKIIELNKKVYNKDPQIYSIYETARQWSLDYFESIYQRLGTKFKRYYFESEAGPVGIEIVNKNLKKVFVEEGGAIIFPKEKSGLHTRVFINSQGLPTYEAKELGLAPTKYKDFPYDKSIIITGNEINEYFKVLLKALSIIQPELAEKTRHLSHGMIKLPSGKMSSRTGDVITAEWLLSLVKNKLIGKFPEMKEDVAEDLTVGAVKYALLKAGIGQDIVFSIDESISLHGNSGPYIQYSFARTQSVLDKSQKSKTITINGKLESEEVDILRLLVHFPEVISESAERIAPNLVAGYLFELAKSFNLFYEKHRITNAESQNVSDFRLTLTEGVGQVLKKGLHLLGIKAPERI